MKKSFLLWIVMFSLATATTGCIRVARKVVQAATSEDGSKDESQIDPKNVANEPYAWKKLSFDTYKDKLEAVEKRIQRLEIDIQEFKDMEDRYLYNSNFLQQRREKKAHESAEQELRDLQIEREKLLKKTNAN